MRTIIDLSPHQLEALDAYRGSRGISRAEAIRQAVAAFLPNSEGARRDFHCDPAFGSSRTSRREDPLRFVRRLRDEWE